jgi:hypothetical protein
MAQPPHQAPLVVQGRPPSTEAGNVVVVVRVQRSLSIVYELAAVVAFVVVVVVVLCFVFYDTAEPSAMGKVCYHIARSINLSKNERAIAAQISSRTDLPGAS